MKITRTIGVFLLGAFFAYAGINHFVMPEVYLQIMPPFLPAPLALVYISGVFEILGGLGVLFPKTRSLSGWGLVLLLIAVFPANLYMLIEKVYLPGMPEEEWLLWIRLPLQGVLIAWVWWAAHLRFPKKREKQTSSR